VFVYVSIRSDSYVFELKSLRLRLICVDIAPVRSVSTLKVFSVLYWGHLLVKFLQPSFYIVDDWILLLSCLSAFSMFFWFYASLL